MRINLSPGGVPKRSVDEAEVSAQGLAGDAQRNREHHGGPQRAVCLWSLERIEALRAEGHPVSPGSCGENLTLSGVDWTRIVPGIRLALGEEVLLEITSYCSPCKSIADSFLAGEFMRISQDRHPGEGRLYARVLAGGHLRPGDSVELLPGASA